MSISNLHSISVKALRANSAGLQITANNVANVGVNGFSRQQVHLVTSAGQTSGAGSFGRGVDVGAVTRSYDAFLCRQAAVARSIAGRDQARLAKLRQLELTFPLGKGGIGSAAQSLFDSFVDLANRPSDGSARHAVLGRAQELAQVFRCAGQQIDALQDSVAHDLRSHAAELNQLGQALAGINLRVLGSRDGQAPIDLLDERDRLVSRMSELISTTTVAGKDGTVAVFAAGLCLVLDGQAKSVAVVRSDKDPTQCAIAIGNESARRTISNAAMLGGSVGGLLKFQQLDLVDARNRLGQLASAVTHAVNERQARGLDARNPPSQGAPLFSVGAPRVLANAANASNSVGNLSATVKLTVVDAKQLAASDYSLTVDPTSFGRYVVTRLSDGVRRSISSGDTVDGFQVDLPDPKPAAGDRFLLQPVGRACSEMKCVLSDIQGIAASSLVQATPLPGNQGTVDVNSAEILDEAVRDSVGLISFTDAKGAYSWSTKDRRTGDTTSTGVGQWLPGTPIVLDGVTLSLRGVPAEGDQIAVSSSARGPTNNQNAVAMSKLSEALLVGTVPDGRITDVYSNAIAWVGATVQSATLASSISSRVQADADHAKLGCSGVSLDEEAVRLMEYQQGYQVAARVLQVAQGVFDSLLRSIAQ